MSSSLPHQRDSSIGEEKKKEVTSGKLTESFLWNTDDSATATYTERVNCYRYAVVWVFLPSLNREEDSETCLHWASVDWHNICSALNQNETFITGRSSVTPLHGNIFFWSEKYIYTLSENNSQLNSPTWRPTSDISQKIEYKVTIVLFFTLNTKQVQAWIDDYFIQICPNTGFIPALIYQALGFLLSCSFNFFLLSFFFFFFQQSESANE